MSRQSTPATIATLHAGAALDVSAARGPQSETAVAVDPADGSRILAGSNDIRARRMRVYTSTEDGRRWTSTLLPLPPGRSVCAASDPGVAVGPRGAEYYSFLGIRCEDRRAVGASVYVASRARPGDTWRVPAEPVASAPRLTLADDRPSLAVDLGSDSPHRGRLYVAWSRFRFDVSSIWADPDEEQVNPVDVAAVVSHSDDRGRTWSMPTPVSQGGMPLEIRLAIGRDGQVYAVWRDAQTDSIYLSRSTDGSGFGERTFVAAAVVRSEHSCHTFRARIAAQPKRCVSPNPVVAVDDSPTKRAGSVYVVWGTTGLNGSQDVDVASFTPDLSPKIGVGRVQLVGPTEGMAGNDQFLPSATVDAATGGLWACYYATTRPGGMKARFTCTASDDGGRSWRPAVPVIPAASDESRSPANVANGYGDYESIAAAGKALVATWTDGSRLTSLGEEIMSARVTLRKEIR
jgi:hypothetical protein